MVDINQEGQLLIICSDTIKKLLLTASNQFPAQFCFLSRWEGNIAFASVTYVTLFWFFHQYPILYFPLHLRLITTCNLQTLQFSQHLHRLKALIFRVKNNTCVNARTKSSRQELRIVVAFYFPPFLRHAFPFSPTMPPKCLAFHVCCYFQFRMFFHQIGYFILEEDVCVFTTCPKMSEGKIFWKHFKTRHRGS